jgi:hypothetical protein
MATRSMRIRVPSRITNASRRATSTACSSVGARSATTSRASRMWRKRWCRCRTRSPGRRRSHPRADERRSATPAPLLGGVTSGFLAGCDVAQGVGQHDQCAVGHGHARGVGTHPKLLVGRIDLCNRPSTRSFTHTWGSHAECRSIRGSSWKGSVTRKTGQPISVRHAAGSLVSRGPTT